MQTQIYIQKIPQGLKSDLFCAKAALQPPFPAEWTDPADTSQGWLTLHWTQREDGDI